MNINPLKQLGELGQSVWLDYIRRDLISSGGLKRLIVEDGIQGLAANTTIFRTTISEGHDYDQDIQAQVDERKQAKEIYEVLSRRDVQDAADLFRLRYEMTGSRDGYVSLGMDPHLAHDATGTFREARRLWEALRRPNVLIQVPATDAGLPAIQQLISEGINVHATLVAGLPRYRQVATAFLEGLEARVTRGGAVKAVASVAGFLVSRIDALVDPLLDRIIAQGGEDAKTATDLRGQTAIASAKLANLVRQEIFGGDRFKALAVRGVLAQRLLWANSGTRDPGYRDVKYVEPLIGPDTISILPLDTLNAFRDHGATTGSLVTDVGEAARILDRLPRLGIALPALMQQIENEALAESITAFDTLMEALDHHHVRAGG